MDLADACWAWQMLSGHGRCFLGMADAPAWVLLCRDEMQVKLKMLDHELNTARLDLGSAQTCCTELEEKHASEQSTVEQLQEQCDQQLLHR